MTQIIVCEFCKRDKDSVNFLIKAPSSPIYICDDCIEQCRDIIGHKRLNICEFDDFIKNKLSK